MLLLAFVWLLSCNTHSMVSDMCNKLCRRNGNNDGKRRCSHWHLDGIFPATHRTWTPIGGEWLFWPGHGIGRSNCGGEILSACRPNMRSDVSRQAKYGVSVRGCQEEGSCPGLATAEVCSNCGGELSSACRLNTRHLLSTKH
ncbi:hypothetical protein J6590_001990 [Homalodisca vitripennis]|nr:hypothetical protein J6590_001990 [Homalodisca vitripennis]